VTIQHPRRYEGSAVVLSALGLIFALLIPYLALALSLIAAGMLLFGWVRHHARTKWARLATLLAVVGIVVDLGYVLTVPST
jgi:hypothetical protein